MKKLILSGANGKMGHVIAAYVKEQGRCEIAAGIDINTAEYGGFPIFASPSACNTPADCIIDFSHPSLMNAVLEHAVHTSTPIVVATTGISEEQTKLLKKASELIPVFFSFNMSLGVNLLAGLAKRAAAILGQGFDIEIIEKHHNQKIDAPSGTAIMLANAVNEGRGGILSPVYERHSKHEKRDINELGIHSIRGGTIAGEHEVIFAGKDEIITLSHSAASKEVFCVGAVNAAKFIMGKPAGLYSMEDIVTQG